MRTLIPSAYAPNVTDLSDAFRGRPSNAPMIVPQSPMTTGSVPFTLVANQAYLLLNNNPRRKGLLIENLDSTATLYIGFAQIADIFSFQLPPLGAMLLDFVCPTDQISAFATANISGVCLEFSRSD